MSYRYRTIQSPHRDRTCHLFLPTSVRMKASRLLHILLLLQTRQRMTTTELSDRLEVSRRTVPRDVEALSAAGVPVYAERGRNGGIVLLPNARLNASHLDPPELEALSIAGLDSAQLERLGLSAVWESAARKIAARQAAAPDIPGMLGLADLVLVDSTAWFADSETAIDVSDLASTLRRRDDCKSSTGVAPRIRPRRGWSTRTGS